jgi:DNA polymerase V
MGKVFDVMKGGDNDRPLDIHDYMVKHPATTFFFKMDGDGPEGSDIKAGDVLVVDRSLTPKRGSYLIVATEGELKVERFSKKEAEDKVLWGVVIGLLRRLD